LKNISAQIFHRARRILRGLPFISRTTSAPAGTAEPAGNQLVLAQESLRQLLADRRVPEAVREQLAADYTQLEAMLEKIERGHIHIAALGRVSVGKSSLLNALLGKEVFSTSPLHGETRTVALHPWREVEVGGVFLIDTPGLDEVAGDEREQMAREVAGRADLVLFVIDNDLTASEQETLTTLVGTHRPVLLVLNKADHFTDGQRETLLAALREAMADSLPAASVLAASAAPASRVYVVTGSDGREREERREQRPDVAQLRDALWGILEREGKTLAALNASLFAGDLSDRVAERILAARRTAAERVIHTYCLAKGVAVALNPVPVADLAAAVAIDLSLVVHLSRVYNLPMTRAEAGQLITTIIAQLTALMGTVWLVHVLSSALKLTTSGLSTLLTGGAQGAVAYFGTYVVGKVAERYLSQGRSWGPAGAKRVIQEILDSLDSESIMAAAREQIRARL
jgi:small GTP-binding protein